MKKLDNYQNMILEILKFQGISLKIKFNFISNIVFISIPNSSEKEVSLDVLRVLDLIYGITIPYGIKYTQSLCIRNDILYEVDISFENDDYEILNKRISNGEIFFN